MPWEIVDEPKQSGKWEIVNEGDNQPSSDDWVLEMSNLLWPAAPEFFLPLTRRAQRSSSK